MRSLVPTAAVGQIPQNPDRRWFSKASHTRPQLRLILHNLSLLCPGSSYISHISNDAKYTLLMLIESSKVQEFCLFKKQVNLFIMAMDKFQKKYPKERLS